MAFLPSNLHVDRPLTDLVVAYDPSQDDHLRNFFFPRKAVDKMSNQIRQISKADMLRAYDLEAGAEGKVKEVQFRTDTTLSYKAIPRAASVVLSGLDQLNADEELQFEQRQTMQAFASMGIDLEYQAVKNVLRSTSIMTSNTTLGASQRWDNFSSSASDPLADLLGAVTSVQAQTGKAANRLAMSIFTWRKLQQHPNVTARLLLNAGGASAGILTKKVLAEILDLEGGEAAIKITGAAYNSAQQALAGAYKHFIGSDVLVARVEDPSLSDFGLGHEFAFSGFGGDAFAVIKYNDPARGVLGSDVAKVVSMCDYKVLNPVAGYLIKTCLTVANAEYLGYMD